MKKVIAVLSLCTLLASTSMAVATTAFSTDGMLMAKRGCCSHHQGVNGCDQNGRVTCNDGSVSPTCRC